MCFAFFFSITCPLITLPSQPSWLKVSPHFMYTIFFALPAVIWGGYVCVFAYVSLLISTIHNMERSLHTVTVILVNEI